MGVREKEPEASGNVQTEHGHERRELGDSKRGKEEREQREYPGTQRPGGRGL